MDYMERIDELGGALAAVEAGFMQSEIQESAYQAQMRIESQEDLVVGVNAYQSEQGLRIRESCRLLPKSKPDATRAHLAEVRSNRDQGPSRQSCWSASANLLAGSENHHADLD